ncbi:hypothetical protein J5226_24420 [Lysobacter sp. K5869]|uniref:hypothetical protein n=1 Tax=Lysobacter sp. K5869 TaxID=2820808 RepID=UPI001C060962|nr:hypothetical protein [Lysobacter sp. K5869]QWP76683.1 hypothetical protein J5226_24420 [Lysobacter sp. K5869]
MAGGPASKVDKPAQAQSPPVPPAALVAAYTMESRNAWIESMLIKIDADYFGVERKLQDKRTRLNIGASTAALLFNVASSLTGSAGVKANYVAANSLATGTQNIVTKEEFHDQTVATLVAAMRARREQAFATIRIGMTKPTGEYLLAEAHRDLLAYEAAGSLQQGMKFVVEVTEKQAAQAVDQSKQDIAEAVAYTEEERQLTYCVSMSLDALTDAQLPALRELATKFKANADANAKLDATRDAISIGMTNRPAKYQRDLYAAMQTKGLLLNPCPRY